MKLLRKQEKKLFKKWNIETSNFVKDGIVSENDYRSATLKVLLILKEANDKDGGGWDLTEHVRQRPRWQTWNTVTRWMIGILRLKEIINWQEISKINEAQRKKYLKSLAIINLKKIPGGGSSKNKEIMASAKKYSKLLNQQFNLYKPHIVICGGTGMIVKEIIDLGKNCNWQYSTRGVHYCSFGNNQHLFRYYHPQSRYPKSLKYYGLIDAIKEAKGYS